MGFLNGLKTKKNVFFPIYKYTFGSTYLNRMDKYSMKKNIEKNYSIFCGKNISLLYEYEYEYDNETYYSDYKYCETLRREHMNNLSLKNFSNFNIEPKIFTFLYDENHFNNIFKYIKEKVSFLDVKMLLNNNKINELDKLLMEI